MYHIVKFGIKIFINRKWTEFMKGKLLFLKQNLMTNDYIQNGVQWCKWWCGSQTVVGGQCVGAVLAPSTLACLCPSSPLVPPMKRLLPVVLNNLSPPVPAREIYNSNSNGVLWPQIHPSLVNCSDLVEPHVLS